MWLRASTCLAVVFIGAASCSSATRSAASPSFDDAVRGGDVAMVEALLADGADPNRVGSLGFTPLMQASNRGDLAMVEALLAAGAEPAAADAAGTTALALAAAADQPAVVVALLGAGADPNERSASGMNALDAAADAGAGDAIELLVHEGLDPNAPSGAISQGHGYPRDRGTTPLGLAVRAGRLEAVEALLANGAEVDGRSLGDNTPLHLAVFFDVEPTIVEALLAAGADVRARSACIEGCAADHADPIGRTVLEWAEYLDRGELLPSLTAGD